MRATCSTPPIFINFFDTNSIWRGIQGMKVIIVQVYFTPLLLSPSWVQRDANCEARKKLEKICGSLRIIFHFFTQRSGRQTILNRKRVNIPEVNLILVSLWPSLILRTSNFSHICQELLLLCHTPHSTQCTHYKLTCIATTQQHFNNFNYVF